MAVAREHGSWKTARLGGLVDSDQTFKGRSWMQTDSEGPMQKRPMGGKSSTTTVTTTEIKQALNRNATGLAAEEEKALRMLHGVGAPHTHVLERVGQDNPETRGKLLDIELELLRQLRQRQTAQASDTQTTTRAASNPRRDQLVKTLRAKKPSR